MPRWRLRWCQSLFDRAQQRTLDEILLEEWIDQQNGHGRDDNGGVFDGLADLEGVAAADAGRHALHVAGDQDFAQYQLERVEVAALEINQGLKIGIPVRDRV